MKSHEISLHINQTYWLTYNDLLFLLMLSSCRTKYFLSPPLFFKKNDTGSVRICVI